MWRAMLNLLFWRAEEAPRHETRRTLHWNPQPDIRAWEVARAVPFLADCGRDLDIKAVDLLDAIPSDIQRHFYLTESHWEVRGRERRFLSRVPCLVFEDYTSKLHRAFPERFQKPSDDNSNWMAR